MSISRYRILLVVYFALFVLSTSAQFISVGYSSELAEAYAKEPETWLIQGLWRSLILVVVFLVPWLISLIGLYFFKPWGRVLAVFSTAVSLLAYPFVGPSLSSGLENLLYEAHTILWGAILAISYFSPIALRFGR